MYSAHAVRMISVSWTKVRRKYNVCRLAMSFVLTRSLKPFWMMFSHTREMSSCCTTSMTSFFDGLSKNRSHRCPSVRNLPKTCAMYSAGVRVMDNFSASEW
jgi:hypothetical protein